jgi:hypothetical protein
MASFYEDGNAFFTAFSALPASLRRLKMHQGFHFHPADTICVRDMF